MSEAAQPTWYYMTIPAYAGCGGADVVHPLRLKKILQLECPSATIG